MASLVPVDNDPFAAVPGGAIPEITVHPVSKTSLVPIDHDPFAQSMGSRFDTAFSPANDKPEMQTDVDVAAANKNPQGSFLDPALQGLTLGTADEIWGLIGGVQSALSGQSFGEGYQANTKGVRENLENYQKRHPYLSAVAEVAGSIPTALVPLGAAARGAGLFSKMGRGATAGAGYGAAYGAGAADDGVANRLSGAAVGASTGATLGAALPVAGAGARLLGKPVADAIVARMNPAGYAARKIVERLEPRGGVEQAANRIGAAAQQGQSMSLADVGGRGVQKLARTVANVPGAGGDRIATKANLSAMSQGDRLKRMVSDVFQAPEGAYQAAKTSVMDARSSAAAPHYARAYASPVPFTFDLEALLQTPAGRAGLSAAKKNSANRREPWAQWFANIADDGSIIDLKRVPDTRALDETKRVLDNMVEAAKRPADGSPFAKAKATPESIAIQSVRDDLVNFLDRENPAYAKARSVALDNIQADDALEFGRNALNTDSRVIAQKMGAPTGYGRDRVFNEGQRELARIGLADAIREKIDKAGLTHNGILKFFATREQAARLKPFFKTPEEYSRFRSQIFNEARKRKTVDAVRGNSTTASQLADMQEAGQMGETVSALRHVASGHPVTAAIQALTSGIRRVGGLTPKVADNIARMLVTSDPQTVRQILGTVRQIETKIANKQARQARVRSFLTELTAGQAGRALAPQPNAPAGAQ